MKSKEKIKKELLEKYNRDKKWCIDYHNKGNVEIYNMIFGRIQGYCTMDDILELNLNLYNDMEKNVPWNNKLLGGHRNTIIDFKKKDVDNI